jgi:hypothetical protein
LGRRVSSTERLEAPFPIIRHGSLADLPSLADDVLLAERKAGDLGGITRTIHLAHPMLPALKRKHPARDKSVDDIIRADVGLLHEVRHEAYHPVGFDVIRLRVVAPVGSTRRPRLERRKIDKIGAAVVLHIEKGSLPGAAGLEAGKLKESAPLAGANDARSALHRRFGLGDFLALDRIDPQTKEAGKRLTSGTNADVGLHEGGITRKIENGVAGKMMRLKLIEV